MERPLSSSKRGEALLSACCGDRGDGRGEFLGDLRGERRGDGLGEFIGDLRGDDLRGDGNLG